MLELIKHQYCIKQIDDLKDFVTVVYVLVDDIYQKVTPTHIMNRRNIKDSIMSDSEIITIGIVGELVTIDAEKAWFGFCKKNLRDLFPKFCDRTRFNRTHRNLHAVIEEIRKELSLLTGLAAEPYRIIDSMPIPVCKFGRAHFHKTFRGLGATYGKCASKKETYLGFKLHLLCTLQGFVTDFILTPANVDDRDAVWELIESYRKIILLGDKGYIDGDLKASLNREYDIDLLPIKRKNGKDQYPRQLRRLIFKLRRRIETSGSQLSQQLNIERVLSKSLSGLTTRLRTKILAHNMCFFINQLLGREADIAKIKELIFG